MLPSPQAVPEGTPLWDHAEWEVRAGGKVPLPSLTAGTGQVSWVSQTPFLPSHLPVSSLTGSCSHSWGPIHSFIQPLSQWSRLCYNRRPRPFFYQALCSVLGTHKKQARGGSYLLPSSLPPGNRSLVPRSVAFARLASHSAQFWAS